MQNFCLLTGLESKTVVETDTGFIIKRVSKLVSFNINMGWNPLKGTRFSNCLNGEQKIVYFLGESYFSPLNVFDNKSAIRELNDAFEVSYICSYDV